MNRRNLLRHLISHKCILTREGAKHSVFVNPIKRLSSTVPRHNEIDSNLAHKICKDLGVPRPLGK